MSCEGSGHPCRTCIGQGVVLIENEGAGSHEEPCPDCQTEHDPYSSHLPVLRAVCGLLKPQAILEVGSGHHSTTYFLSLPIRRLVTVESDRVWLAKLPRDTRLYAKKSLKGLGINAFDLVFVDDGKCAAEREETLSWVFQDEHPPVVVHDADVYASHLPADCSIIPTSPPTAVVW